MPVRLIFNVGVVQNDTRMPTNLLASRVDQAVTVEEVVAATRAYVASLTAAELARIPLECRPTWLVDDEALLRWSDALSARRARLSGLARETNVPLQATEQFFAAAASKVRQLRGFPGAGAHVGDNRPHVA